MLRLATFLPHAWKYYEEKGKGKSKIYVYDARTESPFKAVWGKDGIGELKLDKVGFDPAAKMAICKFSATNPKTGETVNGEVPVHLVHILKQDALVAKKIHKKWQKKSFPKGTKVKIVWPEHPEYDKAGIVEGEVVEKVWGGLRVKYGPSAGDVIPWIVFERLADNLVLYQDKAKLKKYQTILDNLTYLGSEKTAEEQKTARLNAIALVEKNNELSEEYIKKLRAWTESQYQDRLVKDLSTDLNKVSHNYALSGEEKLQSKKDIIDKALAAGAISPEKASTLKEEAQNAYIVNKEQDAKNKLKNDLETGLTDFKINPNKTVKDFQIELLAGHKTIKGSDLSDLSKSDLVSWWDNEIKTVFKFWAEYRVTDVIDSQLTKIGVDKVIKKIDAHFKRISNSGLLTSSELSSLEAKFNVKKKGIEGKKNKLLIDKKFEEIESEDWSSAEKFEAKMELVQLSDNLPSPLRKELINDIKTKHQQDLTTLADQYYEENKATPKDDEWQAGDMCSRPGGLSNIYKIDEIVQEEDDSFTYYLVDIQNPEAKEYVEHNSAADGSLVSPNTSNLVYESGKKLSLLIHGSGLFPNQVELIGNAAWVPLWGGTKIEFGQEYAIVRNNHGLGIKNKVPYHALNQYLDNVVYDVFEVKTPPAQVDPDAFALQPEEQDAIDAIADAYLEKNVIGTTADKKRRKACTNATRKIMDEFGVGHIESQFTDYWGGSSVTGRCKFAAVLKHLGMLENINKYNEDECVHHLSKTPDPDFVKWVRLRYHISRKYFHKISEIDMRDYIAGGMPKQEAENTRFLELFRGLGTSEQKQFEGIVGTAEYSPSPLQSWANDLHAARTAGFASGQCVVSSVFNPDDLFFGYVDVPRLYGTYASEKEYVIINPGKKPIQVQVIWFNE
jgi:hypothetical protein